MRYYSEDTVKRILYDIDYNWESLPAPLEDYKSLELDNDFGVEKGPWLKSEAEESRLESKYKTQKESILKVLDKIGGIDYMYGNDASVYVTSYGEGDEESWESRLEFDGTTGDLVSIEKLEHNWGY